MRRHLPKNLYERGGYYSYRNPETGRELGIGYDQARAIAEAIEANKYFEDKAAGRLVQRLAGDVRTIAAFVPRYRELLEKRPLSDFWRYSLQRYLTTIEKDLGDVAIGPRQEDAADITRRCSDWLRTIAGSGRRRTAQACKDLLTNFFAEAAAAGWLSVNPITVIRLDPVRVLRARLVLEDFWKIYEEAGKEDPWVRRSMELAIVTLQRREDLAGMSFRHEVDGRLQVEQGKSVDSETGELQMRLRIPLSLRLEAVNWSLEQVMRRCRDNVVSPWLLHHTRPQGRAKPGQAIHYHTLTAAFAACRDRAGIVVPEGKTPVTFHELRSLGARLYERQAYNPQALMGHRDPNTTRIYTDKRGAEWVDVAA